MKRGGPLERKTPLRADPEAQRAWQRRSQDAAREREREPSTRAARRAIADPVPTAVKLEVDERSGGTCEVQLVGCGGRSGYQRHHRLKRGAGVHTAANLVGICANCHTLSPAAVHRNVAWSESVGLLIRSTEPPPTVAWQRSWLEAE